LGQIFQAVDFNGCAFFTKSFLLNKKVNKLRRSFAVQFMKHLQLQYSNKILTLTITRPNSLNALNAEVMSELQEVLEEFYQNSETLGLILTGDGDKAFVAGADIKELSILSHDQALELSRMGQQLFAKIEACPKPIIAAINGFALGGGCELAMACHLRIACANARLGQPEINLGIIPGYGGTQRLTQLVGRGKTLELLLTGEPISATEAREIGLINHVVSNREELIALANSIMIKIVSKSPIAVGRIIRSVNAAFTYESDGYAVESENFGASTTTNDFKEGIRAFIEKRQPNFSGT
jgi:enoyl-CoA hydratase